MKRLLLLCASCVIAAGANAQYAQPSLIRVNAKTESAEHNSTGIRMTETQRKEFAAYHAALDQQSTAGKGARTGSRTYNYVDLLSNTTSITDNDNYPYMWDRPDMYGIYSDGVGGLVRDTITLASYGFALHPFWKYYNDKSIYGVGTIGMDSTIPYTLDSIAFYGVYGRNAAKPNIVDTLVISYSYGILDRSQNTTNNMPQYYYAGETANYGVDTVRSVLMRHDSVKNQIGQAVGGAIPVYTKRVLLTAASLADTIPGGLHRIAVSVGSLAIPAKNVVGAALTFKSGDTYAPFSDTAFRGSVNTAAPFKYGMFRPLIFEENAGAFPTYAVGNYNSGQFKVLPVSNGYNGIYIPTWAFVAASSYEFPYVDFRVSCTKCFGLGVNGTNSAIRSANAYPNPSNGNSLNIPVSVNADATVTVRLVNTMGQVVRSTSLGTVTKGQTKTAVFNTSDLAAGVYLYTVEANGDHASSRVMITH